MDDVVITGRGSEIISYLDKGDNYNKIWDLAEHKDKKRSMSSNAYYWKLIDQLSLEFHEPRMVLHNRYLRQMGRYRKIDGQCIYVLLPDTDRVEKELTNSVISHYAPLQDTVMGKDGIRYRWYVQLKGSSEYSTREMAMLLDLVIQDAESVGIKTLTFAELKEIRDRERKKKEKYGTED